MLIDLTRVYFRKTLLAMFRFKEARRLNMVYSKILVGIDGSEMSERALNVAIELCKKIGAELLIAHVIEKPPVLTMAKMQEELIEKALEEYADRLLSRALFKAEKEGVRAKPLLLRGKPGPKLCEAANKYGVDLIIVGSRGLGTISKFIVGSVSDFLVRHCTNKSILIIR